MPWERVVRGQRSAVGRQRSEDRVGVTLLSGISYPVGGDPGITWDHCSRQPPPAGRRRGHAGARVLPVLLHVHSPSSTLLSIDPRLVKCYFNSKGIVLLPWNLEFLTGVGEPPSRLSRFPIFLFSNFPIFSFPLEHPPAGRRRGHAGARVLPVHSASYPGTAAVPGRLSTTCDSRMIPRA